MEAVGKYKKIIIVAIVLVAGLFLLSKLFSDKISPQPSPAPTQMGLISSVNVNADFEFPLKDSSGKEISKVKLTATKAELKDQVILQGKKAAAQNGKAFLTLDLKIKNDYNKSIDVNTRNYFRLSPEGSDAWLAADIHNDPVKVQAISTKLTRIGFTVDVATRKYTLRIGEIDGEKQEIEIAF